MRQLMVLRHAKSDWAVGEADHARTINEHGQRSATLVGQHIANAGLVPDHILCSDAVRAATTLRLAMEAGGWDAPVEHTAALYDTHVVGALTVLAGAPDVDRLLVVGHEPTWSALVRFLTGEEVVMKAATMVTIDVGQVAWAELDADSCTVASITHARHLEAP